MVISKTTTKATVIYSVNGTKTTITGHPADLYTQLDLLLSIYPSLKLVAVKALN